MNLSTAASLPLFTPGMLLSSFVHFWQICTNHVLTSGAYFHFITESNNSLLVHAEVGGKQEHGAPQGPQQGQQNPTDSPIIGGSEGAQHPFPAYTGDITPVLIHGCLSRSGIKGSLLVRRSCAAACGGDSGVKPLGCTKRPPSSSSSWGLHSALPFKTQVSQTPRKAFQGGIRQYSVQVEKTPWLDAPRNSSDLLLGQWG